MNRKFLLFLVLLILSVVFYRFQPEQNSTVSSTEIQGKVIKVKDGDTVEILYNEIPVTVRLEHIDCPEKKQPYGNKAKIFVTDLTLGKTVKIKGTGEKDRYGRLIGEIFLLDETNINQALVLNGLAMHYKQFSSNPTYDSLEQVARLDKRGIWSQKIIINPWDYRKENR